MYDAISVTTDGPSLGRGLMGLLQSQYSPALARVRAPVDEDDLNWTLAALDYLANETGPVLMADLESLRRRLEARIRKVSPA